MSEKNISKAHLTFDQVKEEIKRRADLASIISRHTKLVKSSTGFKACCPLPGHKEKTPSFNINTRENFFYCYGCNRGGDVFKFLELVEGMPFNDALQELSQSLGIELPVIKNFKPQSPDKKSFIQSGYDFLSRTAQFYHRILKEGLSSGAKEAYFYLETRGISPQFMDEYNLGWALEDKQGLAKKIKQETDRKVAQELGLVRENRGQTQDMFMGRLMIPIKDVRGRVVAFSGRTLGEVGADNPKYKNSKESEWFKKKETLYGLFESLSLIRDEGFVCIVEGYFDQWAFHRRGIPAVAVMGTALGEAHLDVLGRFTKQIILVMDTDKAGMESTKRSLPLLLGKGFDVRVFDDLGGKDPDEWLGAGELNSEDEKSAVIQRIKAAPEALEWWAKRLIIEGQVAQMTRLQLLKSLVPVWVMARSQAHKIVLADEISRSLGGLEPSDIKMSLEELGREQQTPQKTVMGSRASSPSTNKSTAAVLRPESAAALTSAPTKTDKLVEEILVFTFSYWEDLRPHSPEIWSQWENLFMNTKASAFLEKVASATYRETEGLGKENLRTFLTDESVEPLVKRALFRALGSETKTDLEKHKITKAWSELALNLQREKLQIQRQKLLNELRSCAPESPEALDLLKRIQELRLGLEINK